MIEYRKLTSDQLDTFIRMRMRADHGIGYGHASVFGFRICQKREFHAVQAVT